MVKLEELPDNAKRTALRKIEHLKICLEEDVNTHISPGFEDIQLIHHAISNLDLARVNLEVSFLNHRLSAPILITAMTGGAPGTEKINKTLALAANDENVALAVGSQRAGIEHSDLAYTYKIVREVAPDIPIIGNIGIAQIINSYSKRELTAAIEMIDADALAIHFNALQEAVQPEGDVNFEKALDKLEQIIDYIDVPIIAKETGAGFSYDVAKKLHELGIDYIEIGGVGGTSFAAVEYYRAKKANDKAKEHLGKMFWDWGIPTVASILEVSLVDGVTIIATGGVRTGIDICKSIALGATIAGMARPFLPMAMRQDVDGVKTFISQLKSELRTCMFLSGAKSLEALKKVPVVITGKTREWIISRFGADIANQIFKKFEEKTKIS